jgi:hypothetical protein
MANYSAAASLSRILGETLASLRKPLHQVDFGQYPMDSPYLGKVDGFRTGQGRARIPQSDRARAGHHQGHADGIAQ